jgi:hypothetical protein
MRGSQCEQQRLQDHQLPAAKQPLETGTLTHGIGSEILDHELGVKGLVHDKHASTPGTTHTRRVTTVTHLLDVEGSHVHSRPVKILAQKPSGFQKNAAGGTLDSACGVWREADHFEDRGRQ